MGPSTGLWFPTEPLQDLIHLRLRAWPSASSVLKVMRPGEEGKALLTAVSKQVGLLSLLLAQDKGARAADKVLGLAGKGRLPTI